MIRKSLFASLAAGAVLLSGAAAAALDLATPGADPGSTGVTSERSSSLEGLVVPPSPLVSAPTSAASDRLVPSGYPSSRNTGVPTGVVLTPHQGDIVVRKDGTVLDKLDITGCVTIRANNVVIRRSRITCAGKPGNWPVRVYDGYKSVRVTDVEIDGAGVSTVAVLGNNYSLTRLNIHNSVDGPRLGSNTSIVDSYVHDLSRRPETHNDTLQTIGGSNILVRGNSLIAYKPTTDDVMNGAIQTGRLHSRLDKMLVEGNYMNGGTYTVRGGSGPRDAALIGSYVFRNNAFGRDCGFGPVNGVDAPVTWETSNHWIDTPDQPLTTNSKANKKRCTKTTQARVKHDDQSVVRTPATKLPPVDPDDL